jgi:hypothetical protein
MYKNLCGNCVGGIELTFFLTVHSRTILKVVKSMCNEIYRFQYSKPWFTFTKVGW